MEKDKKKREGLSAISDQHRRHWHYVKHVRLNLNFSMSVSNVLFFSSAAVFTP